VRGDAALTARLLLRGRVWRGDGHRRGATGRDRRDEALVRRGRRPHDARRAAGRTVAASTGVPGTVWGWLALALAMRHGGARGGGRRRPSPPARVAGWARRPRPGGGGRRRRALARPGSSGSPADGTTSSSSPSGCRAASSSASPCTRGRAAAARGRRPARGRGGAARGRALTDLGAPRGPARAGRARPRCARTGRRTATGRPPGVASGATPLLAPDSPRSGCPSCAPHARDAPGSSSWPSCSPRRSWSRRRRSRARPSCGRQLERAERACTRSTWSSRRRSRTTTRPPSPSRRPRPSLFTTQNEHADGPARSPTCRSGRGARPPDPQARPGPRAVGAARGRQPDRRRREGRHPPAGARGPALRPRGARRRPHRRRRAEVRLAEHREAAATHAAAVAERREAVESMVAARQDEIAELETEIRARPSSARRRSVAASRRSGSGARPRSVPGSRPPRRRQRQVTRGPLAGRGAPRRRSAA
jgi:hypothetical protein